MKKNSNGYTRHHFKDMINLDIAEKLKPENGAGYTIVELLAVVSILVILMGIISGILYSTLRGSNKTTITTEITQSGSYALSIISGMIIDSTSVTNVGGEDIIDCTASPSGSTITLRRTSGGINTLSCANNTISSDSASLINMDKVQLDENGICSFSCSQKAGDPYSMPIISVVFDLKEKNTGFVETTGKATFNTSVSLRNFSP